MVKVDYVLVAVKITESEDGPGKTSDIDMIRDIPHNGSLDDVRQVRDKFLGYWLSAVSERAWARFHTSTETALLVGLPNPAVSPIRGKPARLNQLAGTIWGTT